MSNRKTREEPGESALRRLVAIGGGDSGQCVRIRHFLLGLYNGPDNPFDLTELRALDHAIQEDCLAVLAMDMDGPSVEVHQRPGGSAIADWAALAWTGE